jgi:prepilin-type N-terminal cleavage/methylation domain-containing protein
MRYFSNNQRAGFTLVEMLVSLALFTTVSTITVGALLSLIGGNQRLLKQQTLTSSAIFSFDDMTREIRMGSYYYCNNGNFSTQAGLGNQVRDCSSGATGISVRTTAGDRVAYYFDANSRSLWRRINNDAPTRLLPDDVVLNVSASTSRFFVTGTSNLLNGNNVQQPSVTIMMVLAGTAETVPVTLQTTVTQRSLDI